MSKRTDLSVDNENTTELKEFFTRLNSLMKKLDSPAVTENNLLFNKKVNENI